MPGDLNNEVPERVIRWVRFAWRSLHAWRCRDSASWWSCVPVRWVGRAWNASGAVSAWCCWRNWPIRRNFCHRNWPNRPCRSCRGRCSRRFRRGCCFRRSDAIRRLTIRMKTAAGGSPPVTSSSARWSSCLTGSPSCCPRTDAEDAAAADLLTFKSFHSFLIPSS